MKRRQADEVIQKWITNGHFADYFVTGCRTAKGMVVLLIERGEGVETRYINTAYGPASGTAFVTFDNVRVPIEHTVGPEDGNGLVVILSNFNHERYQRPTLDQRDIDALRNRWAMCCSSVGAQRLILEECLKWVFVFFFPPIIKLREILGGRRNERCSENRSVRRRSFGQKLLP